MSVADSFRLALGKRKVLKSEDQRPEEVFTEVNTMYLDALKSLAQSDVGQGRGKLLQVLERIQQCTSPRMATLFVAYLTHKNLSTLYHESKESDAALEHHIKALRLFPKRDTMLWFTAAQEATLCDPPRLELARQLLHQGIDHDADNALLYDALLDVLYALKDYVAVARIATISLKKHPGHAKAICMLNQIKHVPHVAFPAHINLNQSTPASVLEDAHALQRRYLEPRSVDTVMIEEKSTMTFDFPQFQTLAHCIQYLVATAKQLTPSKRFEPIKMHCSGEVGDVQPKDVVHETVPSRELALKQDVSHFFGIDESVVEKTEATSTDKHLGAVIEKLEGDYESILSLLHCLWRMFRSIPIHELPHDDLVDLIPFIDCNANAEDALFAAELNMELALLYRSQFVEHAEALEQQHAEQCRLLASLIPATYKSPRLCWLFARLRILEYDSVGASCYLSMMGDSFRPGCLEEMCLLVRVIHAIDYGSEPNVIRGIMQGELQWTWAPFLPLHKLEKVAVRYAELEPSKSLLGSLRLVETVLDLTRSQLDSDLLLSFSTKVLRRLAYAVRDKEAVEALDVAHRKRLILVFLTSFTFPHSSFRNHVHFTSLLGILPVAYTLTTTTEQRIDIFECLHQYFAEQGTCCSHNGKFLFTYFSFLVHECPWDEQNTRRGLQLLCCLYGLQLIPNLALHSNSATRTFLSLSQPHIIDIFRYTESAAKMLPDVSQTTHLYLLQHIKPKLIDSSVSLSLRDVYHATDSPLDSIEDQFPFDIEKAFFRRYVKLCAHELGAGGFGEPFYWSPKHKVTGKAAQFLVLDAPSLLQNAYRLLRCEPNNWDAWKLVGWLHLAQTNVLVMTNVEFTDRIKSLSYRKKESNIDADYHAFPLSLDGATHIISKIQEWLDPILIALHCFARVESVFPREMRQVCCWITLRLSCLAQECQKLPEEIRHYIADHPVLQTATQYEASMKLVDWHLKQQREPLFLLLKAYREQGSEHQLMLLGEAVKASDLTQTDQVYPLFYHAQLIYDVYMQRTVPDSALLPHLVTVQTDLPSDLMPSPLLQGIASALQYCAQQCPSDAQYCLLLAEVVLRHVPYKSEVQDEYRTVLQMLKPVAQRKTLAMMDCRDVHMDSNGQTKLTCFFSRSIDADGTMLRIFKAYLGLLVRLREMNEIDALFASHFRGFLRGVRQSTIPPLAKAYVSAITYMLAEQQQTGDAYDEDTLFKRSLEVFVELIQKCSVCVPQLVVYPYIIWHTKSNPAFTLPSSIFDPTLIRTASTWLSQRREGRTIRKTALKRIPAALDEPRFGYWFFE